MSTYEDLGDAIFSSEASATRYMFYKDLNKINIFVEDAEKEYEYETIFKRLIEDYSIYAIFALGGKQNVKEKFNEFGTVNKDNPKIKNFYIVDGDFERYIDEQLIDNPYFIYLKTYNIESYFLDESACMQFSKGRLKCLDREVEKKIQFKLWMQTIVSQASDLFLSYCFIKKHFPEVKNVSHSPYEFIDDLTGFEREEKPIQKYRQYILSLDEHADNKIKEIEKKYIEINGSDYFNLICGKFLFVSLCCYLRGKITSKFNHSDFRWHLINHFDISKLDYIKENIMRLVAS